MTLYSDLQARVKAQMNIRNIEQDLKRKMIVGILPFLRAMVFRILVKIRNKDPEDEEIRRDGDKIFEEMLNDAVSFCNDKTNAKRRLLWHELEK